MGESRSGFSGSWPFGSVAYAGALCESTRSGAVAHAASNSTATAPTKIISCLCAILDSVLLIGEQSLKARAHIILSEDASPTVAFGSQASRVVQFREPRPAQCDATSG